MKRLVLLGGPMGVGKSAVCEALMHRLAPAAFLDGDWCWNMSPFLVNDETKAMVMDNAVSVLDRYLHSPALDTVLFGWVMHRMDIIEELLNRLNTSGVKVHIITLMCSPETLTERLERDVKAGLRQRDVIGRALDRLACCEELPYAKVWTDGLSVEQAAEKVAALLDENETGRC